MPISLRPYDDGDAQPTLGIFRRAVRETARHDYSTAQLEAWAPEKAALDDWDGSRRSAATVVAEMDGRVVGFTDLDATGHIDMLYVDPSVAREGVASALLRHTLGVARRQGLAELTTCASITARPFFERHGFVLVAERHPVRRGVRMTNFAMRRQLPDPGSGLDGTAVA